MGTELDLQPSQVRHQKPGRSYNQGTRVLKEAFLEF